MRDTGQFEFRSPTSPAAHPRQRNRLPQPLRRHGGYRGGGEPAGIRTSCGAFLHSPRAHRPTERVHAVESTQPTLFSLLD